MRTNMEFFALLEDEEQDDLLKFARAYMRVRELSNDLSLTSRERKYYFDLEAKLVAYLEQEEDTTA